MKHFGDKFKEKILGELNKGFPTYDKAIDQKSDLVRKKTEKLQLQLNKKDSTPKQSDSDKDDDDFRELDREMLGG